MSRAAPGPARRRLAGWYASYATFGIPQAAAPIVFALLVLPITGSPDSGAVVVMAMTIAQVVGATPVTRLRTRTGIAPVAYLRVLVAVRTTALVLVAVAAAVGAPLPVLAAAAALAGLVNGAAYGYLRAVLNDLVTPMAMPRALGVAATLNELTFVLTPVVASAVGALSAVVAVVLVAALGAAPALLLPSTSTEDGDEPVAHGRRRPFGWPLLGWLLCSGATGSAVAGVEIGAVSLAVRSGLDPGWGAAFAVALCAASVTGGAWVSIRNRRFRRREVAMMLVATAAGIGLVAFGPVLAVVLTGAAVIGLFLAPLGTHYSLSLDELAPPERRAEAFALLRTMNAIGIITMSALIAFLSLQAALVTATVLVSVAALAVTATVLVMRRGSRTRAPR